MEDVNAEQQFSFSFFSGIRYTPLEFNSKSLKFDYCCGTSEASEQQHNQDLREKYIGYETFNFNLNFCSDRK